MSDQQIDVRGIISHFGGRSQLHRHLTAAGHALSIKTIEKWQERGSIPSKWLVHLTALSATEGFKRFNLSKFIR